MAEQLYAELVRLAGSQPDRVAVTDPSTTMTYCELHAAAASLRDLFGPKGDACDHSVACMIALPSGPHFTAVTLSAFARAALVVPVPADCKPQEARNYVALIHPDVLFAANMAAAAPILDQLERPITVVLLRVDGAHPIHRIVAWGAPCAPIAPTPRNLPPRTAMVQFTSGSTGKPKAVLISAENLLANQAQSADFCAGLRGRDLFCPMPQHHAMGGAVVLEHVLHGTTVHMTHRFMPGSDLPRLARTGCSVIVANPSYFRMLLSFKLIKKGQLPRVEHIVLGSALVERGLIEAVREVFPQVHIHIRYGLSESVGTLHRLSLAPGEMPDDDGVIGFPICGVEVDLGRSAAPEAPAEFRVRTAAAATGMLESRDTWQPLIDAAGWLSTGDLGYRRSDGQFRICGRSSLFIKRNGHRINPFEIEEVLRADPRVLDVAVVGVADAVSGQSIVAFVLPVDRQTVTTRELLDLCKAELSAYKVPQRIVVSDLPRTKSGKIARAHLQERATNLKRTGTTP